MKISEVYQWEIETVDHQVLRQYNDDGSENPSMLIPVNDVVRASIIPRTPNSRPRHDALIDRENGGRFIRRFGRGIMKDKGDGYNLAEYLQCIVTTHYRMWVFSTTGQALVTSPEFEVYL